jgi:hypothetical protein
MNGPSRDSPGSNSDDPIIGPPAGPADRHVFTSLGAAAPGRPAEFNQLLETIRESMDAARSRGWLTYAEKRAVLALLQTLRALVGKDDSPE